MPVHLTCSACGSTFERRYWYGGTRAFCTETCRRNGDRPPLPIFSDDGETALIPLLARDGTVKAHAVVDAADAPWVSQWVWGVDHKGYVRRSERTDVEKVSIRLHRDLLELPRVFDGREGDHKDRDKLNNRRQNLRELTTAQNLQNKGSYRGAKSSFRGVDLCRNGKWRARIRVSGELIHLGYFETEEAAGKAARVARQERMPYAID